VLIFTHPMARFYRVGGTTRLSGFMLAGATAVLLLVGTGPIAYIRVSPDS
jgi:sulfate permease, SulP family